MYVRSLDPSVFEFSLSLHRHPFTCILFNSRFTSPITLANFSSINLVFIFRCSSSLRNQCMWDTEMWTLLTGQQDTPVLCPFYIFIFIFWWEFIFFKIKTLFSLCFCSLSLSLSLLYTHFTDQVGLSNNNPHWNLGFRFLFFPDLIQVLRDLKVTHPSLERLENDSSKSWENWKWLIKKINHIQAPDVLDFGEGDLQKTGKLQSFYRSGKVCTRCVEYSSIPHLLCPA